MKKRKNCADAMQISADDDALHVVRVIIQQLVVVYSTIPYNTPPIILDLSCGERKKAVPAVGDDNDDVM
eukprot:scaffold18926_cov200-Amphora_coffeaeformis.AAC.1